VEAADWFSNGLVGAAMGIREVAPVTVNG